MKMVRSDKMHASSCLRVEFDKPVNRVSSMKRVLRFWALVRRKTKGTSSSLHQRHSSLHRPSLPDRVCSLDG